MTSMQPETAYEQVLRKEKIKYLSLREGDIVLDIGGGSGDVWREMPNRKNFFFHNVEPDDALAKRGEDVYSLRFKDLSNVPYKTIATYNAVTVLGLLEHLDDPFDILSNLTKAKKIYISVPNAESYHRYLGRELKIISALDELGPQDYAIGHKRIYTWTTLRDVINRFNYMSDYNYSVKMWTTSFKFLDSAGMMAFKGKFNEMNAAAEKAGIIGSGRFGAEIVVELNRMRSW